MDAYIYLKLVIIILRIQYTIINIILNNKK